MADPNDFFNDLWQTIEDFWDEHYTLICLALVAACFSASVTLPKFI